MPFIILAAYASKEGKLFYGRPVHTKLFIDDSKLTFEVIKFIIYKTEIFLNTEKDTLKSS